MLSFISVGKKEDTNAERKEVKKGRENGVDDESIFVEGI